MKELQPEIKQVQRQAPRIRMDGEKMHVVHEDEAAGCQHLMRALGTDSADFMAGVLSQLANAVSPGKDADGAAINFALAVIAGVDPKDELETMLGMQMVAVHMATMTFTRRLAHVETLDQQHGSERALNKLARTFAMQLEALRRYRTGGEQRVVVQHIDIREGGQAIVGNVDKGRG
ncbi:MAG: hypothetical protein RBR35_14020 [Salinivirgaceae bacterium]|nr:hypothetical protein [Salinivirgaceae bacterium]